MADRIGLCEGQTRHLQEMIIPIVLRLNHEYQYVMEQKNVTFLRHALTARRLRMLRGSPSLYKAWLLASVDEKECVGTCTP